MATTFYKLKEGDKFYRIDIKRDNDNNMTNYICRVLEMARDASIENYKVRFICYDRTLNKNTMFVRDVGYDSFKYTEYIDNDETIVGSFLTTSKRMADNYCKELDIKLKVNDKEGQDS